MIKINLASRKQAAGGGGESGKSKTTSVLGGGFGKIDIRLDAMKELPIRKVAIIAITYLGGTYLLDGFKEDEMKKIDAIYSKVSAEQSKRKAELGKSKGFEAMKKQLEADEFLIRNKIETIEQLVADRQTPPKLLMAIATTIPETVWLSALKVMDGTAEFKGRATNYNQISDFMRDLGGNAYFTDLKLTETSRGKDDTGRESASFELSAKRR